MPAPDLTGVLAKLSRAENHVQTLRDETDDFLAQKPPPWGYRIETQPETGKCVRYIVKAVIEEPPQPHWALIVGDAIHNLRSALDHLAWELTRKRARGRYTAFPIYDDECEFVVLAKRMLGGFRPEHRAFVEGHQPYRWGENIAMHPLATLRRLSNLDKHRVLVTATTATTQHWVGVDNARLTFETVETGPLAHDAEIMRFLACPEGDTPPMGVHPGLTFHVGLREDPGDRSVTETLGFMLTYIRYTMIDAYFNWNLVPPDMHSPLERR